MHTDLLISDNSLALLNSTLVLILALTFLSNFTQDPVFYPFCQKNTLITHIHYPGIDQLLDLLMKHYRYLLAAAALTLLASCGKKEQPEAGLDLQQPKQVKVKPLSQSLIPSGHWLFNPLHCSDSIPSNGVFDLKIDGNAINYIGITQNGQWHGIESSVFSSELSDYLKTNDAACFSVDKEKLVFARFTAPGTEFYLAFNPKTGVVFTRSDNGIVPGTIFNLDVLKNFAFVQIETSELYEESTPDTESQTDEGVIYENQ